MENKIELHSFCSCCKKENTLVWESDFNYDEVYGEGEGIVTYYHCSNCGVQVTYSDCFEDEYEDEYEEIF